MATTFPTSTYPLSDRTRLENDDVVVRDIMDDGSMRVRVLGTNSFRIIRCIFSPLSESTAQTFIDYLMSNRATEFDLILAFKSPQDTYRGYIWTDPQNTVQEGTLHTISFDFRGLVV